jgi:pimeloyl-ACP methyl ester carboxylesterase
MRPRFWVYLFAFAVYLVSLVTLTRLQRAGPQHADVELPNGAPATLYLPNAGNAFLSINPMPASERAPVAILIHGYSEDRSTMSSLAWRLAQNGYAVLAVDVRGHGENRTPFDPEGINEDIKAAVEFARASALVDGSRLVLIGHSMGAGAAMRYAMRDPRIAATVMIAGLWSLDGAAPPHNPLFLFAQFDPPPLRDALKQLAGQLGKTDRLELGKTYGDFARGDAVSAIEISGRDHMTLPASPAVAEAVVRWLDSATGAARKDAVEVSDPRRMISSIGFAASLVLLFAIGEAAGYVAPHWERRPVRRRWTSVAALAGWLLIAMPVVTLYPPASFVGLDDGNSLVSWLAVAGLLICGFLFLRGELPSLTQAGRSTAAGLAAFVAIYLMYVPLGAVVHRLSLTPHRALTTLIAAVLLIPFFYGFEVLIRRDGVVQSTRSAIGGRLTIVVLLFMGAAVGMLSQVFVFFAWIVLVVLMAFEIFATAAYAASGNVVTIAIAEAASFAWLLAVTLPIRF